MALVKICGITNKIDAVKAADLGADMLGFVFYGKSGRHVDINTVREIVNELPERVLKVGVFVDEDADIVREIAREAPLGALQFHGSEAPEYCAEFSGDYKIIKAFRIKDKASLKDINKYDVDMYLLDTYRSGAHGGTGEVFDWKIAKEFEFLKPVILSGGLNPDNVARAMAEIVPYGVDVSSGVETSPGRKDGELMKRFIAQARKAR